MHPPGGRGAAGVPGSEAQRPGCVRGGTQPGRSRDAHRKVRVRRSAAGREGEGGCGGLGTALLGEEPALDDGAQDADLRLVAGLKLHGAETW